ncbi:hypothetical protein ABVK25_009474 [Lepraria finkii]|uniref:Uncharacterized protein n=1 Tax=Lepraria finkii TaxID=1340010 RepID=A0ABR4AX57_9LECA
MDTGACVIIIGEKVICWNNRVSYARVKGNGNGVCISKVDRQRLGPGLGNKRYKLFSWGNEGFLCHSSQLYLEGTENSLVRNMTADVQHFLLYSGVRKCRTKAV